MEHQNIQNFFIKLVDLAIMKGASDIHIPAGVEPCLRIDGELIRLDVEIPKMEEFAHFIVTILKKEQIEKLEKSRDVDFIYIHGDHRFRGNAFFQQRGLSVSLRLINDVIYSIEDLGLPRICEELCMQHQGLIAVVGPTGHGKSTSLAAMVNHVNLNKAVHIITVEDPVEFIFHDAQSTIEQRELNYDTVSFEAALKSAMRQDPDVLMIGEMRDLETIRSAITMAETGHLVFGTLHTNSAPLAVERLIDVFPPEQQSQIRMQLSNCISAVISQRLIPLPKGGRVLAYEVMIANDAVKNLIRDGKVHHIPNVIQTSGQNGMISLDKCLACLVQEGILPVDIARMYAQDKENMQNLIDTRK